jgi:hypothetical protein
MNCVQNVQTVQPQPEANQPLAELLHAPFNSPISFLPRVARLCRNARIPILVISSGARDLASSATCEEKISRLWLEMTIATQSPRGRITEGV